MIKVWRSVRPLSIKRLIHFRFFKKFIQHYEAFVGELQIGNAFFIFLPKLTIELFIRRKKYEQSFPE